MTIAERNQQILQMRKEGVSRKELARRFHLSPSRIQLIEKDNAAERAMAERRAKVREEIRTADDPDRMWPVDDLVDALDLIVVTRKRLMDHFVKIGKQQISLKEMMDLCPDAPVEGFTDFFMAPILRVKGVGRKGYWSVVNGLTDMGLGSRCSEEWQKRLAKIKEEHW